MLVTGGSCDAAAVWRGAFLARGSLTGSASSRGLHGACPGLEAALALVGAARRRGVLASTRQVRAADRVVISNSEATRALLHRFGASEGALSWPEQQPRQARCAVYAFVAVTQVGATEPRCGGCDASPGPAEA